MRIATVDIERGMLACDEALSKVQNEIEILAINKQVKVLKVIHGYGSHGVGGAIKQAFLKRCAELKSRKIIEDYTCCDKWTEKNLVRKIAINYCPDLLADAELKYINSGCSIIIM